MTMVSLKGKVSFRCSNSECSEIMEIDADEFNMDCIWSDEGNMGPKNGYEGVVYKTCPNCEEEIGVSYKFVEYPIGNPDFIEGPSFDKDVEVLKNTLDVYTL